MKPNFTLFCLLLILCASNCYTAKAQAVNVQDSLALVDLYNSTNGPQWTNHNNWLSGPVNAWYGVTVTGTRVTQLHLSFNNVKGVIPSSIGNLADLTVLALEVNQLSGNIPVSISNLVNLTSLALTNNQLKGGIPSSVGNLINLNLLGLGNNQLSGSIPSSVSNLTKLVYLLLNDNKLTGNIPFNIGNLINLYELDLFDNQLSGSIPASIGSLTNLFQIYAFNNQLSGSIPSSIGNLTNLNQLQLSGNKLSGTIPASIGNLINLTDLVLYDNRLSSKIPSSIGNLTHLTSLFLSQNKLSDTIPSSIGNLVNLRQLVLSNNQLSGRIPGSFYNLVQLYEFILSDNQLSESENIHFPLAESRAYNPDISNNRFTFNGLEFVATKIPFANYAPQARIAIHQYNNGLAVSAGGTLKNNTYKWFKVGEAGSIIIKGDSTFQPTASGQYYAQIRNSIATQLTLTTDTMSYAMPLTKNDKLSFYANVVKFTDEAPRFSVYPNPANNVMQVQVTGSAMIAITNAAGKVVLTKNINNNGDVNVSSFADGVYYLQNQASGEVKKIIVMH